MPGTKLADIFRHYGTDKVEYAPAYEIFLRFKRGQVMRLLEVGIGTLIPDAHCSMVGWGAAHYRQGGSLRCWRDYFPRAMIFGIDTQPDTQFCENRIKTFLCDSTRGDDIQQLHQRINLKDLDIIIDDGSHRAVDQLATLNNLFHFLCADGLYVIEDAEGNGLFDRRREIWDVIGDAVLLAGADFNPVFIQKMADSL